MRVRRKTNLDGRIESCSDYLIDVRFGPLNFKEETGDTLLLDYEEIFGNLNPVVLEIGCGKGGFVCEAAKRDSSVNFIAVEKESNIIVDACDAAREAGLANVRFLKLSAEYLARYLPAHSVKRIYLNFSCPFPKYAHRSHRLTNPDFLAIYKKLLAPGAEIHQKTDNMHFFEYSLESFSSCGFAMKNISLDLHSSNFEGNIMTEYESKFVSMNKPIYRLEAYIRGE